ncbi:MAG: hypothetical protein ACRCZM_06680, partial [Bacteroidales bacterium]
MRNKRDYYALLISFLFGIFVCYVSLQYRYFQIDSKVNIVTSLLSILGIVVGLYIASTLRRQVNSNANRYNFIMPHFFELLNAFRELKKKLRNQKSIKLPILTTSIRNIQLTRQSTFTLLADFKIDNRILKDLEEEIDQLNNLIEDLDIKNNIYDLTSKMKP